jgi:hypothetical protein
VLNQNKMKNLFIHIISIVVLTSFYVEPSKELLIGWNENRSLVWVDFKGHPEMNMPFDALTDGEIESSYEKTTEGQNVFTISVNFDTKKSWVKKKAPTDKLLEHEQGHFDIFEIYGRLYMKKLMNEHVFESPKFNDKANKVFEKNFNELRKFQNQYDKETEHSKNEEKQKEWLDKIKALLIETKPYATKEITFKSV